LSSPLVLGGFVFAFPAGAVGREFAPAGESLSFASPKESNQRKGDPTVCVPSLRYGQPAVLGYGGGPQNSLHFVPLRQLRPLSRLRLRSSAQPEGGGRAFASLGLAYPTGLRCARHLSCSLSLWERAGVRALGGGYRQTLGEARCPHPNPLPEGEGKRKTQGRAKRWPEPHSKAERSKGPSAPLWLRRGAQRFADQGSQLFERSEFCETPRNASTAGCPQLRCGTQTVGSPSFAYFSWRDKKSESPAGARPGLRPLQEADRQQANTSKQGIEAGGKR